MSSGIMPKVDLYTGTAGSYTEGSGRRSEGAGTAPCEAAYHQDSKVGVALVDNSQAAAANGYYQLSPTIESPDKLSRTRSRESQDIPNGVAHPEAAHNGIPKPSSALQQPSAIRSNSKGLGLRYAAQAHSLNTPVRPSHRSASAPVVNKPPVRVGRSASGVQDLVKRFDLNSGQSSPIPRGLSSSGSPRVPELANSNRSASSIGNSRSTVRPGEATREASTNKSESPPSTRATQRPKHTVEDQHSNNTLASAVRVSKPRSRSGAGDMSWGSTVASGSSASPNYTRSPLFGEIIETESGSQIPYGISEPRGRARRSIDSSILAHGHRDLDNEESTDPASPRTEDWYRAGRPNPGDTVHSRSFSDSFSQPITRPLAYVAAGYSPTEPLAQPQLKAPPKSRLPVLAKQSLTPGGSLSPVDLESAPIHFSRRTPSSGSDYQPRPFSPAAYSSNAYSGRGTRGQVRGSGKPPVSSVSVLVTATPPLKSPPLRHSKDRPPVCSATTTSSRNKKTDRVSQARSRVCSRAGEQSQDESFGPPNYAAGRARIMSKIQQRPRQASDQKRLAVATKNSEMTPTMEHGEAEPDAAGLERHSSRSHGSAPQAGTSLSSTESAEDSTRCRLTEPFNSDSPILGIPGTFPLANQQYSETPDSAVSTDTITTMFDNELQTEPPTRQHNPSLSDTNSGSSVAPVAASKQETQAQANKSIVSSSCQDDATHDSSLPDIHDGVHDEPTVDAHTPQSITDAMISHRAESSYIDGGSPENPSASKSSAYVQKEDDHDPAAGYTQAVPYEDAEKSPEYRRGHVMLHDMLAQSTLPVIPTSPPRSSTAHLPKLQTSLETSSGNFSSIHNEVPMSAATQIDSDSESDGTGRAVNEQAYLRRSSLPLQDGAGSSPMSDLASAESDRSLWQDIHHGAFQSYDSPAAPPPPPKDDGMDRPAVPPKALDYTPIQSSSFQATSGMLRDRPGALLSYKEREKSMENIGGRSSSHGKPITAPQSRSPSIKDDAARPKQLSQQSVASNHRRTPPVSHVWDPQQPSALLSFPSSGPNVRRESGDIGHNRPSTSTARSSAFISNDSDFADTPVSSNDQEHVDSMLAGAERPVSLAAYKDMRERRFRLQELVDTEASYVKDMNVLVEIYQGTAEACPDLTYADISLLFRNAAEIIKLNESLLTDLKQATSSVYTYRSKEALNRKAGEQQMDSKAEIPRRYKEMSNAELEEEWSKDQQVEVGAAFLRHLDDLDSAYAKFVVLEGAAGTRLKLLQQKPSVAVWLDECNAVAKELTTSWDLGSLLIKPFQRMTRYPLLFRAALETTPPTHSDYAAMRKAINLNDAIIMRLNANIGRYNAVRQILEEQRKKKEVVSSGSAIKSVFRRERMETAVLDRSNEDSKFLFACDAFHQEYLHLQLIMRDINLYLEGAAKWTDDFLRLLSAIELVVRATPSNFPEIESKWARFNLSMRDIGKIALEQHVSVIRTLCLEPFDQLAVAYSNIQLALATRNKKRPKFLEYEKLAEKFGDAAKVKIDEKLAKSYQDYKVLNDSLKLELPVVSKLNGKIKNFCLVRLIEVQSSWYSIWDEKLRLVLEFRDLPKDCEDILARYMRDSEYPRSQVESMRLTNGSLIAAYKSRNSESTLRDDNSSSTSKGRTSGMIDRGRGYSVNCEYPPSSYLSPDPASRFSSQSASFATANSSGHSLSQPSKPHTSHGTDGTYDGSRASHSYKGAADTRRSSTSSGMPRPSGESMSSPRSPTSFTTPGGWADPLPQAPTDEPAFSDVFQSALPWSNSGEDVRKEITSNPSAEPHAPKPLYVVASLCPFHIDVTKTEGGYPYLTYEEGEIFDVVGEKGELWLAKNQDDPSGETGWIWNRHFARCD